MHRLIAVATVLVTLLWAPAAAQSANREDVQKVLTYSESVKEFDYMGYHYVISYIPSAPGTPGQLTIMQRLTTATSYAGTVMVVDLGLSGAVSSYVRFEPSSTGVVRVQTRDLTPVGEQMFYDCLIQSVLEFYQQARK